MADLVGQTFGKYRLIHKLGIGGLAQVYLGENILIPQMIKAIKVFSHLSTDAAAFKREAQTLAALHHPHMIQIVDYGISAQGIPYLVMPYQSNGNVRQEYPSGLALGLKIVVDFIKQLADALTYAHTRVPPIIHGNLKPQNILIAQNNELLLSDFGSVMRLQSEPLNQVFPQSLVALVYAAPEQFPSLDRPGHASAATDQYALGVLAYELLTSEWPFQGGEQAIKMQKLSDTLPPLRTKSPALSFEVERVVLKALARNPLDRHTSVLDFAMALEQASKIRHDEVMFP